MLLAKHKSCVTLAHGVQLESDGVISSDSANESLLCSQQRGLYASSASEANFSSGSNIERRLTVSYNNFGTAGAIMASIDDCGSGVYLSIVLLFQR